MLRQLSSNIASSAYVDGSVVMSPISPVLTVEQPAPTTGSHMQLNNEWSDYLNMDEYGSQTWVAISMLTTHPSNETEETPETTLHASMDDAVKYQNDRSEQKRASVDEGGNARSHALYGATPDKNGDYHCPFVETEGCEHEPVRLKCNYE